jgi:hypothetical protein
MDDATTDRVLADLAANPPAAPPMSAALDAELAGLQPVTLRRPWRQAAIVGMVALAYAGGLLAVLTVRRDLDELPRGWLVAVGLLWLVGFVVPSSLALVPPAGHMAPRWRAAAIVSVIGSVGFVVLGLVIHPSGPSSGYYGMEQFARGHTCLEIGLATAIAPALLGAVLLRGALPVQSRWVAAALGAGGGSLGGLVLHLHCHVADGMHVGLVHGGVVVIGAAVAAALLPRVTDAPLR